MKNLTVVLLLLANLSLFAKEKQVFWIDVRTEEEFAVGHLPEAVLIPYDDIANEIGKVTKNKNADIRVYCKVGGRAGIAKKSLEKMGYKNVTNAGGYKDILKKQQSIK